MAGRKARLTESEINRVTKAIKEQGLNVTTTFDFENGRVTIAPAGNPPEGKASNPLDRVLRDDYHPA